MTKSRFRFSRVTGEPHYRGYVVLSRRTGLILGNVWRCLVARHRWSAQGKTYGGVTYRTRLEAAKALATLS